MQKTIVLSLVILLMGGMYITAQETNSTATSNSLIIPSKKKPSNSEFKSINIPLKKYGISFGNSSEFTGIRINLSDKDIKRINGLNITFWARKLKYWSDNVQMQKSVVNGISTGIIPTCGTMNGINSGLLRVVALKEMNGLSLSVLNLYSKGNINGLTVSGFITQCEVLSGFVVSGIAAAGVGGINGLAIGGLTVSSDRNDINGVAATLGVLYCGSDFNGVGVSGIFLKSETFRGFSIAGCSSSYKMFGLSIALYNRTRELHGGQIGLLNYAGNNRKGLRYLPLVNMHLKK
jgi:hypothetical protein